MFNSLEYFVYNQVEKHNKVKYQNIIDLLEVEANNYQRTYNQEHYLVNRNTASPAGQWRGLILRFLKEIIKLIHTKKGNNNAER
jgi:hypothetical protein